MDIEKARLNMVVQQIRPWGVGDEQVLDTIMSVPRERFVPAAYQNLAFSDMAIPLEQGQKMLSPREEARLLQALQLQSSDRVLEVGTGSGFMTALLAKLAKSVLSIEIYASLQKKAQQLLDELNFNNVEWQVGDGVGGWPDPNGLGFDSIVITGSLPHLADNWLQLLRPGGRLFVVLGEAPSMQACLFTKSGKVAQSAGPEACDKQILYETVIPRLINATEPEQFSL